MPALIADSLSRPGGALHAARQELLDLGLRNPLLNYRTLAARGLDIVDEKPAELLRLLGAGRAMSFASAPEADRPPGDRPASRASDVSADLARLLAQPDDGTSAGGPASRHTDSALQTPYPSAALQSRLLATFYAARTFVEEQGVNVLYLALGTLTWFEDDASATPRTAPLLLVPVALDRTSVQARFRLRSTGEDVGGNLSLQAKLRGGFGLALPLPDAEADLDVEAYFRSVAHAVARETRWRVDADAVHLGFFLFGKLLMYNDLDAAVWPPDAAPAAHPMIAALLGDGFAPAEGRLGDDEPLDRYVAPGRVHQVVDADSSQTLALLDVQRGHPLVIQGPPGTGKSQTITNLLADAVGQGKTVLFVAEKMAALDVVKQRMDAVHLGDACLELHSHKTNKKALLAELKRTLDLQKPTSDALRTDLDALADARDRLNAYAESVNDEIGATGLAPVEAYGRLLAAAGRWQTVPPPDTIDGEMTAWTRADAERRRARLVQTQALVASMGVPVQHPFWGSRRRAFLPTEAPRIAQTARDLSAATSALADAAHTLADALGLDASTLHEAGMLARAARRALDAPPLTGLRVDAAEWHARRAEIDALLALGRAHAAVRSAYDARLIPEAWTQDLLDVRQALVAHGEKWYRVFIGEWRAAKNRLAGLMTEPLPETNAERLAVVDAVREAQRLRAAFDAAAPLGATLYGVQWNGVASDWDVLARLAAWMDALHADVQARTVPRGLVAFLAGTPDLDALAPLTTRAESALAAALAARDAAVALLHLDEATHSGDGRSLADLPFADLRRIADAWAASAPRLQEIVAFTHQTDALADDALVLFAGLAAEWAPAASHLADAFDHVWWTTLLDAAYRERPALAQFSGTVHAEALRRFVDLDERSLLFSQATLALAHWQQTRGLAAGGAAFGQAGTLYREFSKKSRHLPIRRLLSEAGNAVQAIKPVFMMSPMSVAAYLPPGAVEFDLVVFDEASQVKPVDAFGALLRGRQAVVVGDSQQLPPTSFFDSVLGEADDDEASQTSDVESILELFKSKRAPERMLRWHYRSRHESLIAVSNREFYDGRLVTFPSPDAARAEVGLIYRYLPETTYDKGGRRSNRDEARAVAQAVMAHARDMPALTLLVATFSQAQQREVQDQVEALRRQDPSAEAFFATDRPEPFTVKNLENVQGDERDVVFLSVGYGRDASGAVSMNFGPLNRDGGERRLNVLISRARRRCEVFTNLRADDLDLRRTAARGVAAFKRYLHFAETGVMETAEATGRGPDSPFEAAVAEALRAVGHRVETQVGAGSFRIDLAVVDPARPGRFLLGIACDGATYHSAQTARDRDRIRQSVLEGLGWHLHRVWSTDWFRDPARETARAVAAIERAAVEPAVSPARPDPAPPPVLVRGDEPAPPPPASHVIPYTVARLRGHAGPLHEISPARLAQDVRAVVQVESPVHFDEVARRILDASSEARLGSRIREAVESGVQHALRGGEIVRRGDVLALASQAPSAVPVRDRSALPDVSRKMEWIAPEEVRAAIAEAISESFGIAPRDLAVDVARRFGFASTSEAMRAAVDAELAEMQTAGLVADRAGTLALTPLAAADYDAL